MLQKIFCLVLVLLGGDTSSAAAEHQEVRRGRGAHSVRPHIRGDGTYVRPHVRTHPSPHRPRDNWTTRGNVNPYTGKIGTVSPYKR